MSVARILIVEDQLFIGLALADELAAAGYGVIGPACSVQAAFDVLGHGGVDAALLDRDLSGESSDPVAQRLRFAGIPFAWATGTPPAVPDGVPTLRKPFTARELRQTVEQLVRPRTYA